MALSSSPRKTIPLATGDEPSRSPLTLQPSVTKRVFYCGVVVEGSEHGRRLPEGLSHPLTVFGSWFDFLPTEIQELVLSLGKHLGSEEEDGMLSRRPQGDTDAVSGPGSRTSGRSACWVATWLNPFREHARFALFRHWTRLLTIG
jgi:hypothetical protein